MAHYRSKHLFTFFNSHLKVWYYHEFNLKRHLDYLTWPRISGEDSVRVLAEDLRDFRFWAALHAVKKMT